MSLEIPENFNYAQEELCDYGEHCPCYFAGYECCTCGAIEIREIMVD